MSSLLHQPLLWVAVTLLAFLIGKQIYERTGNSPFLPPILTSVLLVIGLLELGAIPYEQYMAGGQLLHYWLGPVVVMLAVPLYQFINQMKKQLKHILLALTLGSFTTIGFAALLAHLLIANELLTLTMFTKSVTTPVAVAVAPEIGGLAVMASAFVIVTGIIGALMIPPLLRWQGYHQPQVMGLTLGTCAHAIGTARAMELGQEEAAYAAMAMTMTATIHALLLPLII